MAGSLYIGIDGGGSGTRGVIADASGRVIRRAESGATNHHNRALADVAAELRALLAALTDGGNPLSSVDRLCFAGSNIDTPEDVRIMGEVFAELGCPGGPVLCSDGMAQLVHSGCDALIACGTGSIAHGFGADGRIFRVGGWGHKLDDACSGYSLCVAGLAAVLRAHDGRGSQTALTGALLSALGLSAPEQIVEFAYGPHGTPERIAALAPIVIGLGGTDPIAARILDEQTGLLMPTVDALARRAGRAPLSLGLSGSIMNNPQISGRFIGKVQAAYPHVLARTVRLDAALGALALAIDPSLRERKEGAYVEHG